MASPVPIKVVSPPPPPPSPLHAPSGSAFANLYNRFATWRKALDLPCPGTVENLQKEVKATHLTNFFFDGGRADLSKNLSMNPAFQVSHSFTLGSQTAAPSYNFGAVFADNNLLMQGGIDHEGNLNARFNQGWTPTNVTKVQTQLSSSPGHSMIQVEQDYQGQDYALNVKAVNPSPVDFSGIYIGSYLQSVTKNLALGVEMLYQSQAPGMSELTASYLAKYTSSDKNWIATAQVQPAGIVQATYWQKLSEKLDVAADLQLMAMPQRRDALATLGAKYDLRMATFRAQLDSTGKVSALLEQRFAPTFAFLVSGEIDHFKNAAKVGVGVMIESSNLTPEEMEPLLQLKSVGCDKSKGQPIFSQVSFAVNDGDVVVLQGKSGAGKSTILKCIAHLNLYHGEILYRGKPPQSYGIPLFRTRVLYVPQRPSMLPGTPRDFLVAVSTFHTHRGSAKLAPKDGKPDCSSHKAIEVATSWGFPEELWDRRWSNLSGGEGQRVVLAIAVGLDTAEVLLLDEPTSALDAESSSTVEKRLISDLKSPDTNLKALVWITHSPEQGRRVGTRFLRVSSGGVQEEDVDPGV
ncbi:Mitochondrial import receptor subunit TOM40 [Grifola frondosa]|uniref:Translocase of outer membrane 40 kDa subunit n=1 Tax=Grifola frondosa TaxID=5627 RepID=A0A1C7M1Y6_GRIFR|nr:Mitochondrial import receptor subunit TOM40 [Grifola frondosa]